MRQKLGPIERDICGEYKGWNAHVRNGESQCARCLQAAADYARARRHRLGESKSTLYTAEDVALIKAQVLLDAADDAALFGAYGKAWLRERAAVLVTAGGNSE